MHFHRFVPGLACLFECMCLYSLLSNAVIFIDIDSLLRRKDLEANLEECCSYVR